MSLKHPYTWTSGGTAISGLNWNADHVIDADGVTMQKSAAIPATPAAGSLVLFARTIGNGALPAYIDQSGNSGSLQPFFGRNKIGLWAPIGSSSSAVAGLGVNAPSTTGSMVARDVQTTNFFSAAVRSGYSSAATAGSSAGPRLDKLQYWRGNGAGLGGFRIVLVYGCSDAATVSGARSFAGLTGSTTAIGNLNPSTLTNIIGVGTDSSETTLSLMYNDASGSATKVSLGANFPDHTLSTDLYELILTAGPNASEVGVQLTRMNTGDVFNTTISTDLPANTQLLAPQVWRNNGATALSVAVDLVSGYFERPY